MDMDDTLVLILERIDSPVSLIRAASTCRRWRRVIADAGFLCRYRSLHRPPIVGNYYNGDPIPDPWDYNIMVGQRPLFVPSSIDAHRFSLDFLVGAYIFPARDHHWHTWSWKVQDSRGSLLLIEYTDQMRPTSIYEEYSHEMRISTTFPDLVVCDPLTRRYKVIPRPPDFYRASYMFHGPFLIDGDGDEDEAGGCISMSNFRVQCVLFSNDDVAAYTTMFTVAGDTDATWSEKAIDHLASRLHPTCVIFRCLGHALGLYYFYFQQDGMLITRNGSTGKFSSSVLSQAIKSSWYCHIYTENFTVVDGGDGEPRIIIMMYNTMEVFARSLRGEWALVNKVLLFNVTCSLLAYDPLTIVKKGVGFLVISLREPKQQWSLSIDLKTMDVALATEGIKERMAYPCEFPSFHGHQFFKLAGIGDRLYA